MKDFARQLTQKCVSMGLLDESYSEWFAYLTKKQAEGKHYNVALSHATKKLVRLIYALQKSGKAYLAVT